MGIQKLNRFLRTNCPDAMSKVTLWQLKDKKIAIDTSIYMYRFAGEGGMIEGMYQMISTLLYFGVIPVFVFDGEAPEAKRELLQQRKAAKAAAETEYNARVENMKKIDLETSEDYAEKLADLDTLRKKFIRLKSEDIEAVKELMRIMGVTYYEAEQEADEVCAKLVIKRRAWACMSEDMDMFVYGCPRVLRYLSLLNSTAILYDLKSILQQLELTLTEFKEICVLSGTDYNCSQNKETDLYRTLKLFARYKKAKSDEQFYDWLHGSTKYVTDCIKLHTTFLMFDLRGMNMTIFDKQRIMNGPVNKPALRKFLENYDFIFLD